MKSALAQKHYIVYQFIVLFPVTFAFSLSSQLNRKIGVNLL